MPNVPPNNRYTFQNMANPKSVNRNAAPGTRVQQAPPRNQPRIEKLTVHHSYSRTQSGRSITHTERVPSINRQPVTPPRSDKTRVKTAPRRKTPRKRSEVREFMLGFTVGLIIFGAAAFFVCHLIFEMLV